MTIGEIELKDFFKVLFKEFRIALICSAVLAVVNSIRIYFTYDDFKLALTVGLAIMATVVMAKLIAAILPMVAKKLKIFYISKIYMILKIR